MFLSWNRTQWENEIKLDLASTVHPNNAHNRLSNLLLRNLHFLNQYLPANQLKNELDSTVLPTKYLNISFLNILFTNIFV